MPEPKPIEPFERLDDDDLFGPTLFRPIVYFLTHKILPTAHFENHPELNRLFDKTNPGSTGLLHYWSKASLFCIETGAWEDGVDETDAYFDYLDTLLEQVSTQRVTTQGLDILAITLPQPRSAGEAYFCACVRQAGRDHAYMQPSPQSRFLTAEDMDGPGEVMFCEWDARGNHLNFGARPLPTAEDFVEQVKAIL